LLEQLVPDYDLDRTQEQGMYLIVKALENLEWMGVILIATTRGNHPIVQRAIQAVKSNLESSNKQVHFGLAESAITIRYVEAAKRVLDQAIDLFIDSFGNPFTKKNACGLIIQRYGLLLVRLCHIMFQMMQIKGNNARKKLKRI
jgi:hypothetical protein